MKPGDSVGPYILERRLGKGVTASTWLAKRTDSSAPVTPLVLKIFDIAETDSWKPLDQFKREADTLRALNHPSIPRYIESFDATVEEHMLFVLVMDYIEGETVESYIASGKKFTEDHIERMLAELAAILAYLGSLRPPIVHRDINPRNIILRPDGHIVLVDFSGVQDAIRTALYPGATLVGTAGYIPLEQVSGRATHRSDLFGAASTAVFMLTGRNPADLPMRNLKIDLSGLLYISSRLSRVLQSWLDPDPDRRSLSASQAAAILRGTAPEPTRESQSDFAADEVRLDRIAEEPLIRHSLFSDIVRTLNQETEHPEYPSALPSDSALTLQDLEPGLYIKMPRRRKSALSGLAFFPVVWLGFVFFWTSMTMRMHAPMFFPLFSIPFWIAGIAMVKSFLKPALTETELFITPDGLLKKTSGFLSNAAQQYRVTDLGAANVRQSAIRVNNRAMKELVIETGTRTVSFGLGLSDRELYYLEKRVNEEIARVKSLPAPDTFVD